MTHPPVPPVPRTRSEADAEQFGRAVRCDPLDTTGQVAAMDLETASLRLYVEFLRRTRLCQPAELADVVVEELETSLGASDVVLYLVNAEQTALVPVPSARSPRRPQLLVDATMAGRCFASSTALTVPAGPPRHQKVLMPLLDGPDRLGVLELVLPGPCDDQVVTLLERYTHAVAQAILSKERYGDVFERVRRSEEMTLGAELLGSMLPPATFATHGLVISAMLEPTYSNGGDAYDYAVNDSRAHLAVLDGMGHGLAAAGAATLALAAYRHARRRELDLAETYHTMDAAVAKQFGGACHVTAVLAHLDLPTGRLTWASAGHPPPLLIRHGRVTKVLEVEPSTPLGWGLQSGPIDTATQALEPGDAVLFYTDGIVEAELDAGHPFGLDGLSRFIEREASAQVSTAETLRRLRRAIMTHHNGSLRDDATALLLEWHSEKEQSLVPPPMPQHAFGGLHGR